MVTLVKCPECYGLGAVEKMPGEFIKCEKCQGYGSIDDRLVSIHARNVDPDLRRRFKSWCAHKELTMQDAVIMLIEEALEQSA